MAVHGSRLTISQITRQINDEVREVDALIGRRLRSDVDLIGRLADHVAGGGKRLRPMLVLLVARACGGVRRDHVQLAAVIEFIHAATLLHDDVVDDSALRRGRETAKHIWGNAASVLVGDFLYSRAFEMMCEIGHADATAALSSATNVIAEGEVRQLAQVRRADTGEDDYTGVIERKTAALFAAACRTAAMVARAAPPLIEALAGFGLHLGLAFQLVDDLLDYTGTATGKTRGQDLAEGKPTLPFIHAQAHCSAEEKTLLRGVFGRGDVAGDDFERAHAVLEANAAFDYTRTRARDYAARACACLAPLSAGADRDALAALAEFAVARDH